MFPGENDLPGDGDDLEDRAGTDPQASEPSDEGQGEPTDDDAPIEPDESGDEGDDEGPPEPPEDDTEEVDFGRGPVKLPKDLAASVKEWRQGQANRDKELAEQRKAVEAEYAKAQETSKELIAKHGQLAHADDMISRYRQLNWQQLEQEDPQLAQTRLREMQEWQFHRDTVTREITEEEAKIAEATRQRTTQAQQEAATRREEARSVLHRDIPNWSQVGPKVAEFALGHGFSYDELQNMEDPRLGKILYHAMIGSELAAKQPKPKKTPIQTPPQAPLTQVTARSGGSRARPTLEKASMDEYVRLRSQGQSR